MQNFSVTFLQMGPRLSPSFAKTEMNQRFGNTLATHFHVQSFSDGENACMCIVHSNLTNFIYFYIIQFIELVTFTHELEEMTVRRPSTS